MERLTNKETRLADYEDAEEQGLLLRLPCKPGDTIYYIVVGGRKNIIKNAKVIKIVIRDTIEIHCEHTILSPRQVFLTWEEANQALKKMESEGCHGCMDGGNKR